MNGLVDSYFDPPLEFSPEVRKSLEPLELRCGTVLASSVLSASRLSQNPVRYSVNAMRRILDTTPLAQIDPNLKEVYKNWLHDTKKTGEAYMRGVDAQSPSDEVIESLAMMGDPALFVVQSIEVIRRDRFPNLSMEIARREQIFSAYGIIIASIHGELAERRDHTMQTAA